MPSQPDHKRRIASAHKKHTRRNLIWNKINAALALFVETVEGFRYNGKIEASMAMVAARCNYAPGKNGRRHAAHMASRCEELGLLTRVMRNGKTHLWIITPVSDKELDDQVSETRRAERRAAAEDRRRSAEKNNRWRDIVANAAEYAKVSGSVAYRMALDGIRTGRLWDAIAAGDDTHITQHQSHVFRQETAKPLSAFLPVLTMAGR